ncbi:MAG: hypothetical protein P8144_08545 [Gammaproteobacteria bacterium]
MPNSISTVSGYPGVLALTQKYAVSPAYRRLKQLQLSDITNRLPRAKTAAQHSATAALSLGLGIGIGMLIANRDKVHDFNKKIGPAPLLQNSITFANNTTIHSLVYRPKTLASKS